MTTGLSRRMASAEVHDHARVGGCREAIFFALEAFGGQRLAMPGHVEGDDAEVLCDGLVVEQVAELTRIGAGRVQADKWNALTCFLDIETVRAAG